MTRITATVAILALPIGLAAAQSQKSTTENGEAIYRSKCAGCHGADGKGQTAMGKTFHLKDLASADVQNKSNAELFDIIERGKGKMPAYESSLGKDRIRTLVDYLRQFGRKQ